MHDLLLLQPVSLATFLANYKAGNYVLQVSSRPIGQHLASTERGVVCSARDRPSYLVN